MMLLRLNCLFVLAVTFTLAGVASAELVGLDKELDDVDKLREGFETPFALVEEKCRGLMQKYQDPADLAKIYFELAHVEAQSGFQHPQKTIDYLKEAMKRPLDREKKIVLYLYWGSAIEAENEERGQPRDMALQQIVTPYLQGLKETLDYERELKSTPLPPPPPAREGLPGPDNRALAAPQVAKADREHLLETLGDDREAFEGRTIDLYASSPAALDELRKLAEHILAPPGADHAAGAVDRLGAVERLMQEVQKRRDQRTPERKLPSSSATVPSSRPSLPR